MVRRDALGHDHHDSLMSKQEYDLKWAKANKIAAMRVDTGRHRLAPARVVIEGVLYEKGDRMSSAHYRKVKALQNVFGNTLGQGEGDG